MRVLNTKKKGYVSNDQNGFTMIEALFSMAILTLLMTILPLLFRSYALIDRTISVEEDYEWNVFLIQIRDEIALTKSRVASGPRIFLYIDNKIVEYERYGQVIRRKVNNKGHEVVLQNVKNVTFSIEEDTIILSVEFSNGAKEEAYFSFNGGEELDRDG